MKDWRLRPLPVALFALTLAVEVAAVALSWGLESRYDTILYAVYAATLRVPGRWSPRGSRGIRSAGCSWSSRLSAP